MVSRVDRVLDASEIPSAIRIDHIDRGAHRRAHEENEEDCPAHAENEQGRRSHARDAQRRRVLAGKTPGRRSHERAEECTQLRHAALGRTIGALPLITSE